MRSADDQPTAPGAPILVCERLTKVHDSSTGRIPAVNEVELRLEPGRAVGLVGPSGSGKSSLLRLIAGIDVPTAGRVIVAGQELSVRSLARRRARRRALVTHVYQRPGDNPIGHLTVGQQLYPLAGRRRSIASVDDVLEQLDLGHRRDHLPAELSGGEQIRAGFARAAIGRHPLILADEPTAALDTASAEAVVRVIHQLAASGRTVLVASHDQRVIDALPLTIALRQGCLASFREQGRELAALDALDRLQLPGPVAGRFPARRAELSGLSGLPWLADDDQLVVRRP